MELVDKLVGVNRVTKVTKGGRAFSFSAIVVVGDENGVVGHGQGKSKDVAGAAPQRAAAPQRSDRPRCRADVLHGSLAHVDGVRVAAKAGPEPGQRAGATPPPTAVSHLP